MPPSIPVPNAANVKGSWGPVIPMPNVPIHTHVLPNGKVLFWGRRDAPNLTLNEHSCTPQVWDPATNTFTPTPKPKMADGTTVNLFCAGHTFLPDGRLLVAGGHWLDGQGLNQACIYDSVANTWTAIERMNHGRWYPSALTLSDGSVFVLSGSFADNNGKVVNNDVPQIWNNGPWDDRVNFIGLQLFPRLHLAPDGRIFMSGPLTQTYLLDTTQPPGVGTWTPLAMRDNNLRDYAPSVMYAPGKVIFLGGGNDPFTQRPTTACEIIDLTAPAPRWRSTGGMQFARRQHNAVILPDGTVLVTGGTQGGGGPNPGFNDLTPGQTVHTAELWDPATDTFTPMADEAVDRCYHSTAVLLPDATVLSAGGGEYFPIESTGQENDPKDSHRDGQIFSPPYLFRGPRPTITAAPADVTYNSKFKVSVPNPARISLVTWIRLPSVTHSCDQNQRINFLEFTAGAASLTVTAPPNANVCPPGHYMLFVLNAQKVPSVAKIVRIHAPVAHPAMMAVTTGRALAFSAPSVGIAARNKEIDTARKGTHVLVGLTGTCPYGIAACWGGAFEGLQRLEGARWVRPIPDAENSTADVYLADEGLPAIERWPEQFRSSVNGSYQFRGVEVTLHGSAVASEGNLVLQATDTRPAVTLLPIREGEQIQWNHSAGHLRALTPKERNAYKRLKTLCSASLSGDAAVQVTGPLTQTESGFTLAVREFKG
ncbi:MAG: putative galactose oxidase [Chthonomonadaceae bacterium]|nr:putative galactose oxidase [Chthonomonadaceae bacterium]